MLTMTGVELKCQWPATVVHRVDEIAQAHPDHPALREEDGTELTYSQLQDRVSVIANELICQGAGTGIRVGVFQSPSADWICSMLAILRAGGTYVPLDKKVGMERLAILASESDVKYILVDSTTAPDCQLLRTSAGLIDVTSLWVNMDPSVPNFALPAQPAVIMFTSGSTGTPKGITIGHSAYVHHVHAFSRTLSIQEAHEVILHQSSYAWDMSLYQILVSLCNAATLLIASSATRGDPVAISNLITSSKVTTSFATPTEYLGWLRYGRSALKQSKLTTAVSGGEFVSNGLIKEFQSLAKSDLKLINVYGPAETTLACTSGEIPYSQMGSSSDKNSLRLYTLPNYSVYIVDDDLKPVPLGVPGEVVVGGAGIAQGYLDSDRTKERFELDRHASPFFESQGWTKIHRTGDRGKLTSDGALILLGRIDGDNQIKLGGIRVNVEEIEAALVQASKGSISQVVVSPRTPEHGDGSSPFLVAFVVLADVNTHENQSDFLQRLLQNSPLPQYMRPAAIIPIHSVPQNTSGKVDRLAVKNLPIPKLAGHTVNDDTLAPFEETLRQLWQEAIPPDVVSLYTIQSHSDFFHVGGSSLSLVTLQALIKNRFAMAVPLHSLFESSTLQGMAQRIQNLSFSGSGEKIDWDEEIESLLGFDEPPPGIDTNSLPSGAGVVVMTGATGFIGKEVVRQLVDDAAVEAIYCVAVRKPLARLPAIFASSKVHVYHGDLAAPQLGLSDADAASIFNRADIVIHNGADVSFMKSYHTLKMSNVFSTQELVRLALPRRIPFHFVSSASATRLAAMDNFGETSLAAYPPPSVPDDGYTAVKWVSEVFLERVNERFGLPVWIHRPSSVTGTDAPELDLMSNVIRYCQQTKKIPDSGLWSGVFDFISVQSAANLIIEAVHSAGTSTDTGRVRYVHESGEIQLGQDEVQSLMETGTGHQFEVVSVDEWVDHAEKAGMSNLLGIYLRKASAGQVLLPRLIKGSAEAGQV